VPEQAADLHDRPSLGDQQAGEGVAQRVEAAPGHARGLGRRGEDASAQVAIRHHGPDRGREDQVGVAVVLGLRATQSQLHRDARGQRHRPPFRLRLRGADALRLPVLDGTEDTHGGPRAEVDV
jgi:hypothetical protein